MKEKAIKTWSSKYHYLKKAHAHENTYNSPIFYVRFIDEIINLSESINFRTEIEATADTNFLQTPLFLKIDLLFSTAPENVIRDSKNIIGHGKNLKEEEFKQVSSRQYRLNNPLRTLNEFF